MFRPRYRRSALSGVLVVDKPKGLTSMDVVRWVREAAGVVKTGHCGSLDPLASGVVVCCLGSATRHVEAIMALPKVYEAQVDLTAFTATDDREGEREEIAVSSPPTREQAQAALDSFIGEIDQVPPTYSAIRIEGKRAYALARAGETVQLESRRVRVEEIELLAYAFPILALRVRCGRGFYVRTLARDLGRSLGTGGHLSDLRRTAVGPYTLAVAVTQERLTRRISQADLLEPPAEVASQ